VTTLTQATVHPKPADVLQVRISDQRVNTIGADPYYALTIESVTTFVTPEQLTRLADALAQYRTDYTTALESNWDYADLPF